MSPTIYRRRPDCCHWLKGAPCSHGDFWLTNGLPMAVSMCYDVACVCAKAHSRDSIRAALIEIVKVNSVRCDLFVESIMCGLRRLKRLSYFVYAYNLFWRIFLYYNIRNQRHTRSHMGVTFLHRFVRAVPCCNICCTLGWYGHSITNEK